MTPSVLYVITDSGIGGTEKVLHNLLLHLDRKIVNPCGVVVLKNKREMAVEWEKTDVPVHALGLKRWPTPLLFGRFCREVRLRKPTLVHAFLYHSIQMSRLERLFNSSFRLVTSPRVNYRFAPKLAVSFDRCLKSLDDRVVCESEAGRQSLIKNLDYSAEKTSVAWNSVDLEKYCFSAEARVRVRAEWNILDSDSLIGAVGRLHPQKGFDVLIKALKHLQGGTTTFKTVIVGYGPEERALKVLADRCGLPVIFAGERSDVPEILSALDVYVQSSRYEGLSNALLEAMSCARPCIATAVDGTLDFSRDGENMLLVKADDDVSLGIAVGLLLEKPALRKKLAENATITAREFSVERMIQGFEQAYRSVLSKP